MKKYQLNCRGKILQLSEKPILMGILNVTTDSFSDGGQFLDPDHATDHALQMHQHGAAIIDIGAESTRPGSIGIDPDEQIKRVTPVIKGLSNQIDVLISIDTTSSKVAQAALDAGAVIINDISALRFDPDMVSLAAQTKTPIILMHMLGAPRDMQIDPKYDDVVKEVKKFLADRIDFAVAAGVERSQIVVDPGIGFGKTIHHNLLLLKHLTEFQQLDVPLLVGASRKSFIGKILEIDDPAERLFGTAATVAQCVMAGAQIIRVHDVKQMHQVAQLTTAICQA